MIVSSDQRGTALLIVLWGSLLIAGLMAGMQANARTDLDTAVTAWDRLKAEAAINSALDVYAVAQLTGSISRGSPSQRLSEFNGFQIETRPSALAGLVDLNTATERELENLFQSIGRDQEDAQIIAAAIADWRDLDDNPRPNGAEAPDYARAGGKAIGNRPFETTKEIEQVLGVEQEDVPCLAGKITVLGVPSSGRSTVRQSSLSTRARSVTAGASLSVDVTVTKSVGRPYRMQKSAIARLTYQPGEWFKWIRVSEGRERLDWKCQTDSVEKDSRYSG